jgi:hypothetical protein
MYKRQLERFQEVSRDAIEVVNKYNGGNTLYINDDDDDWKLRIYIAEAKNHEAVELMHKSTVLEVAFFDVPRYSISDSLSGSDILLWTNIMIEMLDTYRNKHNKIAELQAQIKELQNS